jgi:hypothetical protein
MHLVGKWLNFQNWLIEIGLFTITLRRLQKITELTNIVQEITSQSIADREAPWVRLIRQVRPPIEN